MTTKCLLRDIELLENVAKAAIAYVNWVDFMDIESYSNVSKLVALKKALMEARTEGTDRMESDITRLQKQLESKDAEIAKLKSDLADEASRLSPEYSEQLMEAELKDREGKGK